MAPLLLQVVRVEIANIVGLPIRECDGTQAAALFLMACLAISCCQAGNDNADGLADRIFTRCWIILGRGIVHGPGCVEQEHWLLLLRGLGKLVVRASVHLIGHRIFLLFTCVLCSLNIEL